MPHLEISTQVAQRLQDLSEQKKVTIDEILLRLLDNYASMLTQVEDKEASDETWTEEELAELLKPKKPMTGKEIVEAGLIGGWENMGIEDSVEWVKQQRAARRRKINW